MMKNKAAVWVIVIALGIFFVRQYADYPSAWDKIHTGMSRQEVYALIGEGWGEWRGMGFATWHDTTIFNWHDLKLSMEGDRVTRVKITRQWIGSDIQIIRDEPAANTTSPTGRSVLVVQRELPARGSKRSSKKP